MGILQTLCCLLVGSCTPAEPGQMVVVGDENDVKELGSK
jgi:hypothetical protein